MFIIQLRFSDNKSYAGQFMAGHNDWLKRGFDDGVFLVAGSLLPNLGGAIIAHNISLSDLKKRVKDDPFVSGNVVVADILEISPSMTDDRLSFLRE